MPRYFFDLFDGRHHKDDTGLEVLDASHACLEARRILSDLVLQGSGPLSAIVSVRDGEQPVVTASISLAMDWPATHH